MHANSLCLNKLYINTCGVPYIYQLRICHALLASPEKGGVCCCRCYELSQRRDARVRMCDPREFSLTLDVMLLPRSRCYLCAHVFQYIIAHMRIYLNAWAPSRVIIGDQRAPQRVPFRNRARGKSFKYPILHVMIFTPDKAETTPETMYGPE